MREEWRDIKGYEGLYQVSNLGNVKSLNYNRTGKEKILKAWKNNNGYLLVNLYKEGIMKHYLVHQLVGNAFLSNPQGYKELNHLNEDKTDCRVCNLEWCSHQYNLNYGTRTKRHAEKLRGKKQTEEHIKKRVEKNCKPIYGINRVSGLIVEFSSAKEAEKTLGISNTGINKCCKGKRKSAGGYTWHYAESEEVANE